MTERDWMGREFYLRRRYRKTFVGWYGVVFWNPSWAAANLDGALPIDVWSGWSLTERGVRRRIAKQLWKRLRPAPKWHFRGERDTT